MINKTELPPKTGYVEVVVDGEHVYMNAKTGVLMRDEIIETSEKPTDYVTWNELATAYTEGVNSIG